MARVLMQRSQLESWMPATAISPSASNGAPVGSDGAIVTPSAAPQRAVEGPPRPRQIATTTGRHLAAPPVRHPFLDRDSLVVTADAVGS